MYTMLLTMKIKLVPTEDQKTFLLESMEQFNVACNFISETAWRNKVYDKTTLQKLLYRDVRNQFGLSAQMTIRAIGKVSDSYRRNRAVNHTFQPHGAMIHDQRTVTYKDSDHVSILTLVGRILVQFKTYRPIDHDHVRGQTDLIYHNNTFYLMVVTDVPENDAVVPEGVLGVDLGIVNLATTNDGIQYSGTKCTELRKKYSLLKARLQKVMTWDAKKHLKKISGRERRFKRDTNHCIAKTLVQTAQGTTRMIALEDLTGIRSRVTVVNKAVRESLGKWAFFELSSFIQYKAKLTGVMVSFVDPAYTSQQCSACGYIDKGNRKTQAEFVCLKCNHTENADVNAAKNIAFRAAVNQPIALRSSDQIEERWKGKPTTSVVGS